MSEKKGEVDPDIKRMKLLVNQRPVMLLPDMDLEIIAERHGIEFNYSIDQARMLSIISSLEDQVKELTK